MSKQTKSLQRIRQILGEVPEISPAQLIEKTKFSPPTVYKNLFQLTKQGIITKKGRVPKVVYSLVPKSDNLSLPAEGINNITAKQKAFIEQYYYYVKENGQELFGFDGFCYWAKTKNPRTSVEKLATLYLQSRQEVNKLLRGRDYLDLSPLIQDVFNDAVLDGVFASDFYTLPSGMGKTKLGAQVAAAKNSEVIRLIIKVAAQIKPTLGKIIKDYGVTILAFIPPCKKRSVQFMTKFKQFLELPSLEEIILKKVSESEIVIEQKTLKSREARILNARNTIVLSKVPNLSSSDTILIIDDLIGSGSSVHEPAKKLKQINPEVKIIAYAIVGNRDGSFEVVKGA
jgi:hypothetical protein